MNNSRNNVGREEKIDIYMLGMICAFIVTTHIIHIKCIKADKNPATIAVVKRMISKFEATGFLDDGPL